MEYHYPPHPSSLVPFPSPLLSITAQVEMLYNVILPFIAGGMLSSRISTRDPACIYRTAQRSGTCYFRCVVECMRYVMHRHGVADKKWKAFSFALRLASLAAAERDLALCPALLDNSDLAVIRIAAKQTARAAVKVSPIDELTISVFSLSLSLALYFPC